MPCFKFPILPTNLPTFCSLSRPSKLLLPLLAVSSVVICRVVSLLRPHSAIPESELFPHYSFFYKVYHWNFKIGLDFQEKLQDSTSPVLLSPSFGSSNVILSHYHGTSIKLGNWSGTLPLTTLPDFRFLVFPLMSFFYFLL